MDLTVARSPLIAREGFLTIVLDRFQGPLDLLLHLIRQQDLDVFEVTPIDLRPRVDLQHVRTAERTATDFADRLRDEVDLDAVSGDIAGTADAALHPTTIGVWIRRARETTP